VLTRASNNQLANTLLPQPNAVYLRTDIIRTFSLPRGNARTETKRRNIRDFKVCKLLAISRRFNNISVMANVCPHRYTHKQTYRCVSNARKHAHAHATLTACDGHSEVFIISCSYLFAPADRCLAVM